MSYQDPVVDKIIVARVGLLLRHPFFGNMATRMKLIEASDWCPTAATDFRNLYYNRDFFDKMTPRQVEFVVCHEILHCAFDHLMRKDHRHNQMWNIAADYCVNGVLVRDRIGDMPDVKCFHDPKYYGKSAEEVYDILMENFDEETLKKLGQLLDHHMEGNCENNGKGPPKYSQEELKQIRDEIKEAMIQSANACQAGQVPGEIRRMIKDLTEPQMNWRQLLRQNIQSIIRNDYTFQRPSRKGWHTGAILPGMNFDETIDIAVSIDMSGSITDEMGKDFLSEIRGIMEEYKDFNIKLWCFDTKVYNEEDFSSYNLDDINSYQLMGGGGTDFMANWNYMKEHDIRPKKFVMFTDGYPWDSWGDEDYCDTLFIIHGDKKITSPFGSYAHYEFSK